jgi:cytochrome c peroxidase
MNTHHLLPLLVLLLAACETPTQEVTITDPDISQVLSIDLTNLPNYTPAYPAHYSPGVLNTDNTPAGNPVTDIGATLGRVLFYDKQLSVNGTVSCASCHSQAAGFSDTRVKSVGFEGGLTDVHSMRLTNTRFYAGTSMFWDKRAANLEAQSTQPIQNPVEMGFDAAHGGMGAVVERLNDIAYYPPLFNAVFGDPAITEQRIQRALAQFVRSMVSVNSAFDTGIALTGGNPNVDFPNFTAQQNAGKRLFLLPRAAGGVSCALCHQPPTFALVANSLTNGLDMHQTVIFKSPSLKSVALDGAFMHDGRFTTLDQVVRHYSTGVMGGPNLDNRLRVPGGMQPLRLNLSQTQIDALVAFMHTLTDETLRTDAKFSDPFIRN